METVSFDRSNVEILEDVYYEISEFMKKFRNLIHNNLLGKPRQRPFCRLTIEELMTILIGYQIIGGKDFKSFYKDVILQFHKKEFPKYISYDRFISVAPMALAPLCAFLQFRMEMSEKIQLYVVDSTKLVVCENLRISRHKTFKGIAARGKTGSGWFFGFKLHVIINHIGQLMAVHISAGNLDDRKGLKKMVHQLKGKLLGDSGYLSKKLFEELFSQGLDLMTTLKKNMKKKERSLFDKILLRKRAVIESVNDILKNHLHIDHSRHRSWGGFMINSLNALIAYTFYPKKPHMRGIQLSSNHIMELV